MIKNQTQKEHGEQSNIEGMTHDDVSALQSVLEHVKGAYPDSPYKPADFLDSVEE